MPFSQVPSVSDLKMTDFSSVQFLFDELLEQDIHAQNVKPWLDQWSNLSRAISEAATWIHVGAAGDTANKDLEKALITLEEKFVPPLRKAEHALTQKFLNAGQIPQGMEEPSKILDNDRKLFREENLSLEAELAKLSNHYGKMQGAWSAKLDGKTLTREEIQRLFEDPDRTTRKKAWLIWSQRYLKDREKLDTLYDSMKALRIQSAHNADYKSYTNFRFAQFARFEYSPQDCLDFHDSIAATMVPLTSKVAALRKRELKLDKLMPWDAKVDWMGDEPLKPFKDSKELAQKLSDIFHKLAPELAPHFDKMRKEKWLDMESRPGKRGGGFCAGLDAQGGSFIFMNAAGTGQDIFTLAHEAGHSFHNFESMGHQPWAHQHDYPIEFAEVASMSMELLIYPYLDEFYSKEDAARARLGHLCDIASLFGYVAAIDAFQHYIYGNPEASHAERDAEALRLHRKLCPDYDFSELKDAEETVWQRKLHVFEYPFYYIDYAMAQIGALQIWKKSLVDEKKAIKDYTQALRLGGTKNRPQLFEAAGAEFRFDQAMLQKLAATLELKINEALKELGKSKLA